MPHSRHKHLQAACDICCKEHPVFELFPGTSVRAALLPYIAKYSAAWNIENKICINCLNRARSDFVEQSLRDERGVLSDAEKHVIDALRSHEAITENPRANSQATRGEQLADGIAAVGGSWTFIAAFCTFLACWILANTLLATRQMAFDPYPFIFLNLVLSCIAALQAPIIMMSQNRQAEKDRLQAEADYKTNLKAELEIRHLHIKMDQLLSHQWQKLLEIQQVQLDVMRDSMTRKN